MTTSPLVVLFPLSRLLPERVGKYTPGGRVTVSPLTSLCSCRCSGPCGGMLGREGVGSWAAGGCLGVCALGRLTGFPSPPAWLCPSRCARQGRRGVDLRSARCAPP